MTKTRIIGVRFSTGEVAAIAAIAQAQGRTMSGLIWWIVTQWLRDQAKKGAKK